MSGLLLILSWLCLAAFPLIGLCESTCGPGDNEGTEYVVINETDYDRTYARIGSGKHPLGFYSDTWYYNQGTANPCVRITAPDSQQRRLEIMVETVPPARLCVKDQSSNEQCFQGTGSSCRETPGRVTYVEFLCDSGCQEADVSFWYRLVLSPPSIDQDLNDWCFDRPNEFPQDLAVSPDGMTLPTLTTRKPRDDTGKASQWMSSSLLVASLLLLILFLR